MTNKKEQCFWDVNADELVIGILNNRVTIAGSNLNCGPEDGGFTILSFDKSAAEEIGVAIIQYAASLEGAE